MKCNLCGSEEFVDMNQTTRKNVKCKKCGSLERTRLLWMYLQKFKIDKETKLLHIAPEKGLYKALLKLLNKHHYIVGDVNPKQYSFVEECIEINLCNLENQPSFEYDLIIHSHVLEHIPCNIAYTLFHLHRMLKKDGYHIFIIPFLNGKYDECFQHLSHEERIRRFGQHDHLRRFGKEDISSHIGKLVNIPYQFDATKDFKVQDLRNANIPKRLWKGFHGSTVLCLKRNDMNFVDPVQ